MTYKMGIRIQLTSFPPRRILFAINISVTLLTIIISCQNPFSTRDPEPPTGMQATWLQPVSPEIVTENFKAAIREKNVENYIRCFGLEETIRQKFIFVPEPSVANNYQGVFTNWDIVKEKNYINHLFSLLPADSISSLIITDVTEFHYGDSVRTTKEYDLLMTHTNASAPKHVLGRMELSLQKSSDELWYIAFWADFKTGDFPVWSLLKAEF